MVTEETPIEQTVVLDRNYPSVSERYYTKYYFIPEDLSKPTTEDKASLNGNEKEAVNTPDDEKDDGTEVEGRLLSPDNSGHTCVMVHTNKLCLITLSHRHPVLAEKKEVTNINFDVGKFNRLNNQVSGKGKRGAQQIGLRSPVCIITCSDGSRYTILAGVHGKLIEVNEKLISRPQLLSEQPDAGGYLAVVFTPLRNGEFMKSKLLSKEEYEAVHE